MDNQQKWESNKSLIMREVMHGCELAKELHNLLHLHLPLQLHQYQKITESSAEIASSFTKVLELLGCTAVAVQGIDDTNPRGIGIGPHSSPAEIPHTNLNVSENPTAQRHVDRSDTTKRRKGCPRWIVRVRGAGASETGSDGPPDDGYTWRKYGQKDIIGSQHPRSYYRCTHKTDMGCEAQKQVQRAYDDPSCFEVTYIGVHSCHINPPFVHPQLQNSFSVPASVVLGGCASQSESSTSTTASARHERGFLFAIPSQEQLEIEAAMTTMSLLTPATDAPMDFSGLGSLPHAHREDTPAATIFREDKSFNFIDFLPPQPKETVDAVQYYVESGSSFMNVDSVETASPKMLDLDMMLHTDDASEIQFGEKLPWNIKQS